jgi:hypothetical protein
MAAHKGDKPGAALFKFLYGKFHLNNIPLSEPAILRTLAGKAKRAIPVPPVSKTKTDPSKGSASRHHVLGRIMKKAEPTGSALTTFGFG